MNTNQLQIDFLYLDLDTCTRCRGSDRNLEAALGIARGLLAGPGSDVEVSKIHVESAEQARELRFESSPTLRVNGRDVALELRESPCGSEACTDGCGESISCRVWLYGGEEHTEPPVAMIVDAILREAHEVREPGRRADAEPYVLPDNLERFFADKEGSRRHSAEEAEVGTGPGCCSEAEQSTCCEPGDKAECCGTGAGGSCGCR
jgi:hypothetical protein